MDLKTGRASSWKKERGGGSFARPDTKLDVIEFNGSLSTTGGVGTGDDWLTKAYGEGGGAYNVEFGSGQAADPVVTQANGDNLMQAATFNTFGRAVKITEANMCMSKQGGNADSTVDLAVTYLDVRNVADTTVGGTVVPGTTFGALGVTYTSTLLAKKTGMLAPSDTDVFTCHDLNSTFKGLTIPEGCLVFICVRDTTGGTNNAIGINGSFIIQML